jgi:hypothetical protein
MTNVKKRSLSRKKLEIKCLKQQPAENMCRRKKKLCQESIINILHDKFGRNETRKYYEGIRSIKHGFQPRTNMCQDKLGNLVAGDAEVLNRWKEYSEEHLNYNVTRNVEASGNIYYGPKLAISEPRAKMVYDVIKNLKNRRALLKMAIVPNRLRVKDRDCGKKFMS